MILVVLALLQPGVPPPAFQLMADCVRPTYVSDQLLCADPGLRGLDSDLAQLLAEHPEPVGPWVEPQGDWFRRSRLCAFQPDHQGCLAAAYRERIGLLRPVQPSPMPALRCRPNGVTGSLRPEGLLLRDRNGDRLGLAAPASNGWRPHLEMRPAAGKYEVRNQEGRIVARCPHAALTAG